MKWYVLIGCLATLARFGYCNVLRCHPGSQDSSCASEEPETVPVTKNPALPLGRDCAPGSTWKTECNTCRCLPDGTSTCTKVGCINERPLRCAPDTTWKNNCNSCYCNGAGQPVCTKKFCITNIEDVLDPVNFEVEETPDKADSSDAFDNSSSFNRKVRALSQEPPKACQPGTEFRMDCNKCLCDNEGKDFSCTRIDCNALNNNNNGGLRRKRETTEKVSANCSVGSVFERGCNVCRCTETGYALCTTNKCKDQTDKPSTDVQSSDFDANFRCNPGEQYSFDCNDCTCSADGRSIFCTLRFCDQSLTRGL